jgi:hypothetical protein
VAAGRAVYAEGHRRGFSTSGIDAVLGAVAFADGVAPGRVVRAAIPHLGALGGVDVDGAGAGVVGQATGPQHRPDQVGLSEVLVGRRLRLGMGEEARIRRNTVVDATRYDVRPVAAAL